VERLVLCGSAGLFERNLSGKIPRVSHSFIREQASKIFHDPRHVSDDLVDDIYAMLSERDYRRFLLRVAKATRDRYMLDELSQVNVPTLIIWGRDDAITPPFVAEQFRSHIRDAGLVFLDHCGHAPPIEQPEAFARLMHAFLKDATSTRARVPRKPR
jgi:pimeloyl-ACP methyl ester carboxylesterase